MNIGKGLQLKKYQIYSPLLPIAFDNYRFIFLSDLHGKVYGKNNAKLIDLIHKARPDCILIGGDMVVGGESKRYREGYSPLSYNSVIASVELLSQLSNEYKIIHALGNHEEKLHPKLWEEYRANLEDLGIHIVDNDKYVIIDDNGESISIYGLSLGREYYPKLRKRKLSLANIINKIGQKDENYSILMAHSPLYFDAYSRWKADLTLSGHLHGGIMRLPIAGGVIGPDFFLFPKYSGGVYTENGSTMIVSCGAGSHTINLRVFNPPELSLVELKFGEKLYGN